MTGELDGKMVSVQGKVTDILNCQGAIHAAQAGPASRSNHWMASFKQSAAGKISMKDQAMKIAIEAVKTYPYDSGSLKIDYKPGGGVGTLKLDSTHGGRQFDMYWHPFEASSNVANDTNNK